MLMKAKGFIIKRWKLLAIILIILLVSGRIVYVNIYYPQTVKVYYAQGDTFEYSKLNVSVDKMTVYTKDSFMNYATDNLKGFNKEAMAKITMDYYVYIVDITVNNPTDSETKVSYGQMAISIGNVSNGSNTYLNKLLNQEEYSIIFGPSTTRTVSIAYTIPKVIDMTDKEFKAILDKKCTYSFKEFYHLNIVSISKLDRYE